MRDQQRKTGVALLSVVSNTALVVLKIIVGVTMGSVSVLSEAIHSGVDLLAAVIALFAVRTSGKAADEDHPWGHGKAENISGTIEALLIFVAAAWIIYEAVHKLVSPKPIEQVGWGVAVMLFSVVANMIVSHMLFKVGKQTDSIALLADAWHLRTDVWTSVGVSSALAAVLIGTRLFPDHRELIEHIDPIAAIAVALLIIRAAYHLTLVSARDLMDVSLPPDEEATVRRYIEGLAPRVRAFHGLRTRKAGAQRFIQFHMLVNPEMIVADSHRIAEETEQRIAELLPGSYVAIHVEPCDGKCRPMCLRGCLLDDAERTVVSRIRQEG